MANNVKRDQMRQFLAIIVLLLTAATTHGQGMWQFGSANGVKPILNRDLDFHDSDHSHLYTFSMVGNATANRAITWNFGDAARAITVSGDTTLDDWFDQSVKRASSPILAGLTVSAAGHVILPLQNDAATPTLSFGDGDSGFYENSDDDLRIAIAGAARWSIDSGRLNSNSTGGGGILRTGGSLTTPCLHSSGDVDTGIGFDGANQLSLVTAGANRVHVGTTGNIGVNDANPGMRLVVGGDNEKLGFGAAEDCSIYYDGTNMVLNPKEIGSGGVVIEKGWISCSNVSGSDIGGGQFFGRNAGIAATESYRVTAVGSDAAGASTTGFDNVCVGASAGYWNRIGARNTIVGSGAGYGAYLESYGGATLVGYAAGNDIKAGADGMTAVGSEALSKVTTAQRNTALGYWAGKLTTGISNTAVGWSAMAVNTSGGSQVAVGEQALTASTTGTHNTAVGAQSMVANTTGSYNAALGWGSLDGNEDGSNNTGLGRQAGYRQTSGDDNVFVGYRSGDGDDADYSASKNTVVGVGALFGPETGANNNSVFGYHAGYALTTGTNNLLLGYQAGDVITTGGSNIIIGYDVDPSAAGASSELNIGDAITGDITVGSVDLRVKGDLVTNTYNFGADAEASDTYVITLDPAPAAYTTGMMVTFTANTANTGACTLNVNALGAKSLKAFHDQDPPDNYIEAGSAVLALYDGTNFQLLSPDANP